MKLKTLKPRLKMAHTGIGKAQVVERMRGGNLQRRNRRMLMRNPLCVLCLREGRTTEVEHWDHIIPLWEGGPDTEDNLQGLCAVCHERKTKLEAQRRPTY